ncbi:hypothetical protein QQS21_002082 [Conoideocrella luteorostrata]|uniref:Uncharacterized protein n=1 Tax=Conoideocrella luteorostrata TaxID=1105319 RepID=A0AAJ0CVU5_9HYPO|nr:hypothetical protein QQS21_002082 [Conoideocrella luteorostrata]
MYSAAPQSPIVSGRAVVRSMDLSDAALGRQSNAQHNSTRRGPLSPLPGQFELAANNAPMPNASDDAPCTADDDASVTTVASNIGPEKFEVARREYEQAVRALRERYVSPTSEYVRYSHGSRASPQVGNHERSEESYFPSQRALQCTGSLAQKRKVPPQTFSQEGSREPENSSSFLASIRTWRQNGGKRRRHETYFQLDELKDVRRDKKGKIQFLAMWKPIWVSLNDLRGDQALEAARELIVNNYGESVWIEVSDGWDAMEPYAKDRIEYEAA